jgi:hypothetical protein
MLMKIVCERWMGRMGWWSLLVGVGFLLSGFLTPAESRQDCRDQCENGRANLLGTGRKSLDEEVFHGATKIGRNEKGPPERSFLILGEFPTD